MPRECNHRTDYMAKIESGSKPPIDMEGGLITIKERSLPSIQKKGLFVETCTILMEGDDWRILIIDFLSSPSRPSDRRTRMFVTRFILLDEELFKKGIDDNILLEK